VDAASLAPEDARDVLDFFSNLEVTHREPPFPMWTGLCSDRESLSSRLSELGDLRREHRILREQA